MGIPYKNTDNSKDHHPDNHNYKRPSLYRKCLLCEVKVDLFYALIEEVFILVFLPSRVVPSLKSFHAPDLSIAFILLPKWLWY